MIQWANDHADFIVTLALLLNSEFLASNPKIKANANYQLIVQLVKSFQGRKNGKSTRGS